MPAIQQLPFERPVQEIEQRLAELERAAPEAGAAEEVRRLRRELAELIKRIYSNLEPWETVQVARHPDRPQTTDYLDLVFDEFVELHGDNCFGDDRALRTGFAKLDRVQGARRRPPKGQDAQGAQRPATSAAPIPRAIARRCRRCSWPPSIGLPVICLIDTPGAYPGIGAEERGQAQVIAESMLEMSRLPTPIICVVIGEGGSGGALGIGVGDRVAMLRVRLLLGDQPRRLRRHPLEEPRLRRARRQGAEAHLPAPARSSAWSTT